MCYVNTFLWAAMTFTFLHLDFFKNLYQALLRPWAAIFTHNVYRNYKEHVSLGSKERNLIYGHLWDKFHVKCFIRIILFYPQNNPLWQELLYPCYRLRNSDSEKLGSLPKLIQPVSDTAGLQSGPV